MCSALRSHVKKAFSFIPIVLIFCALGCGGGHFPSVKSSGSTDSASFTTKFAAGIAHVAGNYGFTQSNFLVEGARKINDLGSDSIFIYLTPYFRTEYPDQGSTNWPGSDPANLVALAKA